MGVSHFWYTHMLEFAFTNSKVMDFDGDAFNALLTAAAYTPNQDTHEDEADVTNELGAGCGYSTGGDALGGEAASTDTTPRLLLDATDASWTCATFTANKSVTYDTTPVAACGVCDSLWTVVQFGACESVTAGTFTIQWDCCPAAVSVICPANLS